MIHDIMNQDRMLQYGFYQVGEYKFYSKFEAQILSEKSGLPIRWNFNDEAYDCSNWQVEPVESIGELYRQRAQQLRDQYDYLVLWFSGGADSTNILDSFVLNNIKLDEVVSYVNYDANGDKFNWLNGEIYNVAIPRITKAQEAQPGLKYTMVDLCRLTMDFFNNKDAKFDWSYQLSSYVNPNNAARQDIKLTVPEWKKMFDAGKKVGFIHGVDKPFVTNVNGKFYYKFHDMIDPAVSPGARIANRPWDFDELFYWSPGGPKIPIKQGHLIKNFLKTATEHSPGLTQTRVGLVSTVINKKIYHMTMDQIHRLIYPNWYPVPYQWKSKSLIFTARDEWFYKLPDSDPAKYAWKVGLEHRWSAVPDQFKNDPTNLSKGFKQYNSKLYFLGN
jgi:hypothetical protein